MNRSENKIKYLPLRVILTDTKEKFRLSFMTKDMSVYHLKVAIELASGIPLDLQIVHYLDQSEMKDTNTLKTHDIVPEATLNLSVWHSWKDIVKAAAGNEFEWLMKLGVSQDSVVQTPFSNYMMPRERLEWLQQRLNTALLISAHRGHVHLCRKLLKLGADVNSTTPAGRTALHLAAIVDRGNVIQLLLNKGANVEKKDNFGHTAMSIAKKFGQKGCERHLFMFRWQQRAKSSKPQYLNPPCMTFQLFESFYPRWMIGPAGQMYVEKLLPCQEFIGSSFDAPKRNWHRRHSDVESERWAISDEERKRKLEEWLQRKLVQQREKRTMENVEKLALKKRREERFQKLKEKYKPVKPTAEDLPTASTFLELDHDNSDNKRATDKRQNIKQLVERFNIDNDLNVYQQWYNMKVEDLLERKQSSRDTLDVLMQNDSLSYQAMLKEFCLENPLAML